MLEEKLAALNLHIDVLNSAVGGKVRNFQGSFGFRLTGYLSSNG